jgi:hypothetical protein
LIVNGGTQTRIGDLSIGRFQPSHPSTKMRT